MATVLVYTTPARGHLYPIMGTALAPCSAATTCARNKLTGDATVRDAFAAAGGAAPRRGGPLQG